jgi:aspartyl-tRNA synthetase
MVAGFDRYYQIARCYRDETSKPDRQPEFTQVDIEMSFVNEEDIINLIESLLAKCWPFEKLKVPFRRMKYEDAINLYGVDKPDLRFDMKFLDLSHDLGKQTGISKIDSQQSNIFAYGFKINQEYEPNMIDLNQIEKEYKLIFKDTNFIQNDDKDSCVFLVFDANKSGNHIIKYMNDHIKNDLLKKKFNLKENEKSVLLVGKNRIKLLEILGKLRLRVADLIDEKKMIKNSASKLLKDPKKFEFLWVIDFPLFTLNEETNKLESTHHPFTAPISQHLSMVMEKKDLDRVTGLHYDIVLNGSEIGGGSIRIHNSKLQRHVLQNILQEDTSQLEHLINALEYGAPPHGGIALGLDRLVAIMCGTSNIRNVIAFPKAQSGRDIMSSAPSRVAQTELDYYNIKCVEEIKK